MQTGIQTKENMLSLKIRVPEVTIKFHDGRPRHAGNSSDGYKMGTYRPVVMQIGEQTSKKILIVKFTVSEVTTNFQDGPRRHNAK
jgi:hypothetical protein